MRVIGSTSVEDKILPVTEMSIAALEEELQTLKLVCNIIHGSLNPIMDIYNARIRDIENELFERSVLIQS